MDGGSVLKGKESSGGAKWSGSQETWKEPEEKAASNSANPLSMCLSALLNQDRRASTRMALAISRYLLAPHKGKRGSSVPYSNGRRQVKTAWGREQSPQPAVAEMVCIQRAGPQSSSVLWAVTLSYYRAVSFPFCHVFCVCVCVFLPPPKVVYFKFPISTVDGGKAIAYMCCADPWAHLPPPRVSTTTRCFLYSKRDYSPVVSFRIL